MSLPQVFKLYDNVQSLCEATDCLKLLTSTVELTLYPHGFKFAILLLRILLWSSVPIACLLFWDMSPPPQEFPDSQSLHKKLIAMFS
eukprot:3140250-Amphidinium_carterae.2